MRNPSFSRFGFDGTLYHEGSITVHGIRGYAHVPMQGGAWFMYVHKGIVQARGDVVLTSGMYGVFNWGNIVVMDKSEVLLVHHSDHQALHTFGGPIEERGRLAYIDGCTDTQLLPPVRKGDPCLNFLHFPIDITQRQHTHPSIRVGIVAGGYGECITPFGNAELREGDIFLIHPENGSKALGVDGQQHLVGTHSFRTRYRQMSIVALHPDSEVGPTDEYHQMKVATIIDGVKASDLELHQ